MNAKDIDDMSVQELRDKLAENDNWEPTFESVILENSGVILADEIEYFKAEFERCSKLKDEGVDVLDWKFCKELDDKYDGNPSVMLNITDDDVWDAFEDYYKNHR